MSKAPDARVLPNPDEPLLTLPEVADHLGILVTRVHDLLNAGKLLAVSDDGVKKIPRRFLNEDEASVNRFVPGVITLLRDGGYAPDEIVRYLFTEDDSLPGRPVDALHGHLAREVMRRAQAMAF